MTQPGALAAFVEGGTGAEHIQPNSSEDSFHDLNLRFEPEIEMVRIIYTDPNGNDLLVGKLTKTGAVRLIARIAKVFHIPVEVK